VDIEAEILSKCFFVPNRRILPRDARSGRVGCQHSLARVRRLADIADGSVPTRIQSIDLGHDPLTRYDRSTFYGGDGRGYIDYPAHADMASAAV
jgi:hypothetical protein